MANPSVSATDRLTAYKIVGHFFGLSYRQISGSNLVENSFFRISNISVPCPHAQLRGRTVIKKLWTFFGPWGRDHSQSPPCWIFRVKQIHPSTASERTRGNTKAWWVAPAGSQLHEPLVDPVKPQNNTPEANTAKWWSNSASVLAQRLRRWASTGTLLNQHLLVDRWALAQQSLLIAALITGGKNAR